MTDLTPNDLSHLSDEDFNALCPQGEHAPGSEPLSPASQAVLDAVLQTSNLSNSVPVAAAALRAVAAAWDAEIKGQHQTEFIQGIVNSMKALLEIADELEALDD